MFYSILSVSIGAAAGALLRWVLGIWLADSLAWLGLGTLAANWIGSYLIGIAAALTDMFTAVSPNLRLLLITGFLGGLTTFSGFSLEIVAMLQAQRWAAAFAATSLHLFGSLILTILGMMTVSALRSIMPV